MICLTLVLIAISALLYVYGRTVKPPNFPPGPKWNPINGCTSEVIKLAKNLGGTHIALQKLSEIYKSNVIGLKYGRVLTVCVNSNDLIRYVLTRDEFQGRPMTFFSKLRSFGTNKGITFTNGELWTIQRRFLMRHMRELGYGKQRMNEMIIDEVRNIIRYIESDSKQIRTIIGLSVVSILWMLVAGEHLEHSNERLQHWLRLMNKRTRVFDVSGGWLNIYPWLRFIAPKATGYDLILNINAELKNLVMTMINEHKKKWQPGRKDDIIYAFLSEMNETKDETFTDDQLVMICVDMLIGGSTTTSSTISFALMCMILYPHIQRKVYESIMTVYPHDEVPNYKDRHLLPYVEAVLCEVERCYLVAPITGPRVTSCDTKIDSYDIPKDTVVLLNNYAVNHDSMLWDDPETFRPERFLDHEGNVSIPQYFYPFNIGKRKCIADALARNCVFTFFVSIMKTFEISLHGDSNPLTGRPIPGILITPEEYVASLKRRTYKI